MNKRPLLLQRVFLVLLAAGACSVLSGCHDDDRHHRQPYYDHRRPYVRDGYSDRGPAYYDRGPRYRDPGVTVYGGGGPSVTVGRGPGYY